MEGTHGHPRRHEARHHRGGSSPTSPSTDSRMRSAGAASRDAATTAQAAGALPHQRAEVGPRHRPHRGWPRRRATGTERGHPSKGNPARGTQHGWSCDPQALRDVFRRTGRVLARRRGMRPDLAEVARLQDHDLGVLGPRLFEPADGFLREIRPRAARQPARAARSGPPGSTGTASRRGPR